MAFDPDQVLRRGITAHQAGDLAGAAAAYEAILAEASGHADANHLLGLVRFQSGDADAALSLIRTAIGLDAKTVLYHANLGRVLMAQGSAADAVRAFRDAVRLEPKSAGLHADLASALLAAGDADAARSRAYLALDLDPNLAESHLNLGLALQEVRGAADAEAERALRRALQLKPTLAGAYLGLGVALHERGDNAGAEAAYEQALAGDPSFVEAHCNLGNLKRDACDFPAAVDHYRAALALDDTQATVWGNLAVALQESGDLDAALEAYDAAARLAPDDAEMRRNRGMALLAQGRYAEGWADYGYRWRTERFRRLRRDWGVPEWDGGDPDGKRILVHAEQGLGDTLQFCRYLPLLAGRGAIVTVECADTLRPLLSGMKGVAAVIAPGDRLPHIDFHIPMLSLPKAFGTNEKSIAAEVPYLTPPKSALPKWERIAARWPAGTRIGIAWRGSAAHTRDALRSPGLAPFGALADIDGAVLVSLQKEGGAAELAASDLAIVDPTGEIDDFGDTAALMTHLDWVVACDTAPLHLAGALGRRTVAVLPHVSEWRWGREGERTPWYPTLRLVRQPAFGDWAGAFERVVEIVGR